MEPWSGEAVARRRQGGNRAVTARGHTTSRSPRAGCLPPFHERDRGAGRGRRHRRRWRSRVGYQDASRPRQRKRSDRRVEGVGAPRGGRPQKTKNLAKRQLQALTPARGGRSRRYRFSSKGAVTDGSSSPAQPAGFVEEQRLSTWAPPRRPARARRQPQPARFWSTGGANSAGYVPSARRCCLSAEPLEGEIDRATRGVKRDQRPGAGVRPASAGS